MVRTSFTSSSFPSPNLPRIFNSLSYNLRTSEHKDPEDDTPTYPHIVKLTLLYIRWLITAGILLIIISGFTLRISILKAGAAAIVLAFAIVACATTYFAIPQYMARIGTPGQRALWLAFATLPFYAVRSVYLLLAVFGTDKFDPVLGDWRYLVGMGLSMEMGIVVLLIAAGVVVEPLRPGRKVAEDLMMRRDEATTEFGLQDAGKRVVPG